MAASQIEFTLAVAVCAWCKPKDRGAAVGVVSHGICPRHMRKMKLEARGQAVKRRRRGAASVDGEDASNTLQLAL